MKTLVGIATVMALVFGSTGVAMAQTGNSPRFTLAFETGSDRVTDTTKYPQGTVPFKSDLYHRAFLKGLSGRFLIDEKMAIAGRVVVGSASSPVFGFYDGTGVQKFPSMGYDRFTGRDYEIAISLEKAIAKGAWLHAGYRRSSSKTHTFLTVQVSEYQSLLTETRGTTTFDSLQFGLRESGSFQRLLYSGDITVTPRSFRTDAYTFEEPDYLYQNKPGASSGFGLMMEGSLGCKLG